MYEEFLVVISNIFDFVVSSPRKTKECSIGSTYRVPLVDLSTLLIEPIVHASL